MRSAILISIVLLAAAGCAGTGAGDPAREATVAAGDIGCGQAFQPPAGGELRMTARFPATVAAADGVVTGTVEVTGDRAVRGVAAPRAQAFLVRDGLVVSMPVAQDLSGRRWDLAPGAVEQVPADAALVACAPGGGPLPAGRYEIWARLLITPDDGPGLPAVAGPYPLEIV